MRRLVAVIVASLLLIFLVSVVAWAGNCQQPTALAQAKIQLANALDIPSNDPVEMQALQLTDVQSAELFGEPVCIGQLRNPKFSTMSVWAVTEVNGQFGINVLEAMDPQFTNLMGN